MKVFDVWVIYLRLRYLISDICGLSPSMFEDNPLANLHSKIICRSMTSTKSIELTVYDTEYNAIDNTVYSTVYIAVYNIVHHTIICSPICSTIYSTVYSRVCNKKYFPSSSIQVVVFIK